MFRFLGLLFSFATVFFILAAIISAFRKTGKVKKMLLSSVGSFILLVVVAFIAISNEEAESLDDTEPEVETTYTEPTVEEPEANDEDVEITREEEIEEKAKGIINYNFTKVEELDVNENLGLNDGSYIVLPHLKWDAKNNAKRTKTLLEMYSDDLAANLAKEGDISELVVFWEVPYHLEGKNVAKFTYTKNGENMIIGERWYDSSLR
ncbi:MULTISPECIES: hypothetical protein [unclassified Bacillus (in: firmicutes)]|uniref:hypothetical protein n=1 Tax=unclassified Bacillus (in: firmicutes) TaxID=185979 RepID=UPI001BE5E922|nr:MULTISPECIES: hypothetical protein [unclassified Bacillus (in: firmicutes)]MBT2615343.1 hypothetical protein [Bacillus sp. ISL-78]MBT2628043.1 hypothetical protein [Bacillus sp. ISL-101]